MISANFQALLKATTAGIGGVLASASAGLGPSLRHRPESFQALLDKQRHAELGALPPSPDAGAPIAAGEITAAPANIAGAVDEQTHRGELLAVGSRAAIGRIAESAVSPALPRNREADAGDAQPAENYAGITHIPAQVRQTAEASGDCLLEVVAGAARLSKVSLNDGTMPARQFPDRKADPRSAAADSGAADVMLELRPPAAEPALLADIGGAAIAPSSLASFAPIPPAQSVVTAPRRESALPIAGARRSTAWIPPSSPSPPAVADPPRPDGRGRPAPLLENLPLAEAAPLGAAPAPPQRAAMPNDARAAVPPESRVRPVPAGFTVLRRESHQAPARPIGEVAAPAPLPAPDGVRLRTSVAPLPMQAPAAPVAAQAAASDVALPIAPAQQLAAAISAAAPFAAAATPSGPAAAPPVLSIAAPPSAGGTKVLTIALDPQSLGRVTVSLRLSGEVLAVTIETETRQAARLLDEDRRALADMLKRVGVAADEIAIRTAEPEITAPPAPPAAPPSSASGPPQPAQATLTPSAGEGGRRHGEPHAAHGRDDPPSRANEERDDGHQPPGHRHGTYL